MKTCRDCGRVLDSNEEESGECDVCYSDRLDMSRDDERGNGEEEQEEEDGDNGEGAEGESVESVCEDYSNLN